MEFFGVARRLIALGGITGALAVAHAGCSTMPTFVPDGTSGAGGGSSSGSASSSSGSSGGDCKTADDCPGDENECAHRTCTAGKCGTDFSPAGFLVGAQTMGDCQKTTCDGKGAVTTVPDDADKPSDGNTCTVDLCAGGKPSHPPASKGTACGATSMLSCDGAGNCAGCTADKDCGVNTPCAAFTCDVATTACKITYVAAGTGDPGNQQAGDCKKNVCNGSGGTSTQNDDTDVPNDGNACTDDHCSMGTPSHSPSPLGTTCGGSFKCDGNGSCAGCVANSDCGQNDACASFACTAGSCKSTYVPSGQGDPGGQVTGDCKKNVCNGSGSPTTIPDDADVPVDGNVCTNDVCSGGVPSNPPVASGTGCGGNLKCDGAGSCKGCLSNADCGAGTACTSNVCQAGNCVSQNVGAGTGCGGNNVCDGSGNCVCSDPSACNGKCGSFNNACGQPVNCGNPCGGQDVCGGGNVCVCQPSGCPGGTNCGTVADGCGGKATCGGGCAGADTCGGGGVANVCGCTPSANCSGKCGLIPDGCGGNADCGNPCVSPQTCGGGGTPNVCGCTPDPDPCGTAGFECGSASNGCGAFVGCGGCDPGMKCIAHTCICLSCVPP